LINVLIYALTFLLTLVVQSIAWGVWHSEVTVAYHEKIGFTAGIEVFQVAVFALAKVMSTSANAKEP
jgi:hypothetical protein